MMAVFLVIIPAAVGSDEGSNGSGKVADRHTLAPNPRIAMHSTYP